MNGFWRQSRGARLESELVQQRPTPRDEFVVALSREIEGRPQRSRKGRLGAVAALTGVALIALGASGGAGYASSVASTTVEKITSAVHLDQSSRIQRPSSSAVAQYCPETPADCFVRVPPYPPGKPAPTTPPPPATPPPPTSPGTKHPTTGGTKSPSGGAFKPPSSQKPGSSGTGGTNTTNGTSGSTSSGTSGSTSSGLPFTGLSLWIPVLAGLCFVVLGFVLRRGARREPSS